MKKKAEEEEMAITNEELVKDLIGARLLEEKLEEEAEARGEVANVGRRHGLLKWIEDEREKVRDAGREACDRLEA